MLLYNKAIDKSCGLSFIGSFQIVLCNYKYVFVNFVYQIACYYLISQSVFECLS